MYSDKRFPIPRWSDHDELENHSTRSKYQQVERQIRQVIQQQTDPGGGIGSARGWQRWEGTWFQKRYQRW